MSRKTRFLNACRRAPVDTTPIWLMRQAGRYMAEYRKLRKKYSLMQLIVTPELAVEVTLQPVQAFAVDAAIIFADILPVLSGLGLTIDFSADHGPKILNPIRKAEDITRLKPYSIEEFLGFTLKAIKTVRHELRDVVPLIGFSGAPFTLASYAVEGGGSHHFLKIKDFIYHQEAAWQQLMDKLTIVVGDYLCEQIKAGAQAVQMFDSWAGILSPQDFHRFVLPAVTRIIARLKKTYPTIPVIYFGTETCGFIKHIRSVDADVIGIDWRVDILDAWSVVGDQFAIQGNLDPLVLRAPISEITRQAGYILDRVNKRPGHIFNLGHGVQKETPPDHVAALIDFVHEHGRQ